MQSIDFHMTFSDFILIDIMDLDAALETSNVVIAMFKVMCNCRKKQRFVERKEHANVSCIFGVYFKFTAESDN